MRSQFFTSFTSMVLLAFSLCITGLISQPECVHEDEVVQSNCISDESVSDVLNPIYIFK
jgi:hypothetical protein